MGRCFGTQIYQWQVVTGGMVAVHQPPRAISSSESGSRGFCEEQDNSHIFGQRDSHVLLKQGGGGDSISSSEHADIGHSDILSGSWNFSTFSNYLHVGPSSTVRQWVVYKNVKNGLNICWHID